jgi:hypothetical protein
MAKKKKPIGMLAIAQSNMIGNEMSGQTTGSDNPQGFETFAGGTSRTARERVLRHCIETMMVDGLP